MASRNQRTLAAYERIALDYAESTKGTPSGEIAEMMQQLVGSRPSDGVILDLGSGPGWDADYLESLGARVRRTDATQAFCGFQRARGHDIDRLDAITSPYTDPEWPRYDGVLAMYMLQHIERKDTFDVLKRVSDALATGALFLVSIREGSGEEWEGDSDANRYHLTLWDEAAFTGALNNVGLEPVRIVHHVDSEGPWLIFLARKQPGIGKREQA